MFVSRLVARLVQRLTAVRLLLGLGPSLCPGLQRGGTVRRGDGLGELDGADPLGLAWALRATGRYCQDTRLGRLCHWGSVSIREAASTNSLHITVDGNRVSAHIDRLSPLDDSRSHDWSSPRYRLRRVVAHVVAHIADALDYRLNGDRCRRLELECSWEATDEDTELVEHGDPTAQVEHPFT